MELKSFTREITWLTGMSTGWGNGYVAVPKEHKLFGVDYNSVDLDVHGGLTYASDWSDWMPEEVKGMWVFGFDCCHWGDDLSTCPKEYVEAETEKLKKQLIELS